MSVFERSVMNTIFSFLCPLFIYYANSFEMCVNSGLFTVEHSVIKQLCPSCAVNWARVFTFLYTRGKGRIKDTKSSVVRYTEEVSKPARSS